MIMIIRNSPPPNAFVEDVELFLQEIGRSPKSSVSELSSIYYFTGAMVHFQLRIKSCSSCSDILLSTLTAVMLIDADVFD